MSLQVIVQLYSVIGLSKAKAAAAAAWTPVSGEADPITRGNGTQAREPFRWGRCLVPDRPH
jgi:hypothetical protein